MGINVNLLILTYELEQMSKYLDLIETAFVEHYNEVEASYRAKLSNEMDEDEVELLTDQYLDEFMEAARDFPQLQLLSFIVTWYSFVEQQLLDLCNRLKLKFPNGPKANESFGKGIYHAHKFLAKVQKYEIDQELWQQLLEINKLRNVIVHQGKKIRGTWVKPARKCSSYVSESGLTVFVLLDESVLKYLEQRGMLERSDLSVDIVPTPEYCKYLVEFGKTFFSKLYSDLQPQ